VGRAVGRGVAVLPDPVIPPGGSVTCDPVPVGFAVGVDERPGVAGAPDGVGDAVPAVAVAVAVEVAVAVTVGMLTLPSTPPTRRIPPATVTPSTIATITRAAAASDRRESNLRKTTAIDRRTVIGRATTMGYTTAQEGHAPAASFQHPRQAYLVHSEQ
jgi:hypothetical protein